MKTTNFERIESIVSTAKKSIDYQVVTNHQTWGVNFLPEQKTVLVLSPLFTLEIAGLNEVGDYLNSLDFDKAMLGKDGSAYYSYFSDKMTYSPLARPSAEIMGEVLDKVEANCKAEFNINSMLNVIGNVDTQIWNKSRVVFAQGFSRPGTAPIKFANDNGRPAFSIKGINKPCVITDGDDFIPVQYIEPNQTYECTLEQTDSEILIRAIRKYGLVKFGVHISEHIFDPQILPALNNFDITPDDLIVTTNKAELPKDRPMSPLHLAAPMLYDILIMMRSVMCENITIHFPEDSNTKPCVIESINAEGIKVRAIVAPLNQSYGIQRR